MNSDVTTTVQPVEQETENENSFVSDDANLDELPRKLSTSEIIHPRRVLRELYDVYDLKAIRGILKRWAVETLINAKDLDGITGSINTLSLFERALEAGWILAYSEDN